jgi:methionyl aminopeptidase
VRDLVGHGIGRKLHEEPASVPNFGKAGKGELLREGITMCIEPMVNQGKFDVITLPDKWTLVTKDGKLSAHFEHTVAITRNGPEILTQE